MIELLNEQKQAIITHAVTRGLDPNVKLKRSGIDWLGDLPETWNVLPVRRLSSFITSGPRGWSEFIDDHGDLFIQSGNLGRSLELKLENAHRVRTPVGAETQRTRIKFNDVLICVTGALTGNVAHVAQELPAAYVNQHVALVRPDSKNVAPRFLAYALHSTIGKTQFKLAEYGGTKQGLSLSDVASAQIILPPLSVQSFIVSRLDEHSHQATMATIAISRQIAASREYRTRLIADVVTGKVDVRHLAPADAEIEPAELLPDDADSSEPGEEDEDTLEEVEVADE